jgi:hypothetical protein
VARFEFPYMAERRKSGKKRPPDREPVPRAIWLKVINKLGPGRLVIGGKSAEADLRTLLRMRQPSRDLFLLVIRSVRSGSQISFDSNTSRYSKHARLSCRASVIPLVAEKKWPPINCHRRSGSDGSKTAIRAPSRGKAPDRRKSRIGVLQSQQSRHSLERMGQ